MLTVYNASYEAAKTYKTGTLLKSSLYYQCVTLQNNYVYWANNHKSSAIQLSKCHRGMNGQPDEHYHADNHDNISPVVTMSR